jgi:excisionase family DNA binding protein
MTHQTENHPARLLFDLLLDEFRDVIRQEVSILRDEIKRVGPNGDIPTKTKRFYSLKEAAAELNLSQATVRRLIDRGILARSKATSLVRIPAEQIDQFSRTTM